MTDYKHTQTYLKEKTGMLIKRGQRVRFMHTRWGTVTNLKAGQVWIRLDDEPTSKPFHPTWELSYYEHRGVNCQICGHPNAVSAWQPFGPHHSPRAAFTALGNHCKGFPVIKVCEACYGRIKANERIAFRWKGNPLVMEAGCNFVGAPSVTRRETE